MRLDGDWRTRRELGENRGAAEGTLASGSAALAMLGFGCRSAVAARCLGGVSAAACASDGAFR
jgi:hypothetical protein